jgi:hypothetical protein
MKSDNLKIMVQTDHYWGIGDTLSEALQKAKNAGARGKMYYIAYIVQAGTYVDGMGFINYPDKNFAPKKIHEVLPKKRKAA